MPLWSGLLAKPQRTPLRSRPSLTLYFLLAGAFLLTLVPHVLQFPVWLTLMVIAAMVLRSVLEVYRLPLPSTTFCGILAFILFGLVWIQFGAVMGRVAGTSVTAGLLAIKFFEIRQPRDIALIIFCCFFVVMSALLFSQALELFVYCLIMMWVLTALLMRVQAGDRAEDMLLTMLLKAGRVFLQALPLAVFLFLFFPRINGPLGFPLSDPPIGLTDTIAPGSVSKLAQDDTPAMYVKFTSNAPLPDAMYWRALVLYQYKNGVFTIGSAGGLPIVQDPGAETPEPKAVPGHEKLEVGQEITILPNNQRWLYALDVPISVPHNTAGYSTWGGLFSGNTIQITLGKLDHLARYVVTSSPYRQEETINWTEYDESRQLPTAKEDGPISPAVKALSDKLYQEAGGNADAYLYNVLRYFHHGGFLYSIDLPPQKADWLTDFLIDRKTGYCEHFATAFAVLMRLKQIHTRLVAGYVGGDLNPYSDGEYVVLQSNAHAWDEVWKPTNPLYPRVGHWTRIDPTAIVSGAEASAPSAPGNAGDDAPIRVEQRPPSLADSFLPGWIKTSMREMRLRREHMEMTWDNVVLSYDTDAQFKLAQVLGFGLNPMLKLLLVCLGAAGVCSLALWRWLAYKPGISPVEFLYSAFCRNMARRGVPRAPWEGPLAYTERVAEAFPEDMPALRSVGAIVARARYGPVPADSHTIVRLESALALISASQAAVATRERK
jgi:transglutaminase-like putative cysteine protease